MARLIKFQIEKQSFDAGIIKVDREKVYGWIETVYSDLNNLTCTTATLLDDGQTLLTSGGVASKTVNSLNIEIVESCSHGLVETPCLEQSLTVFEKSASH